jgi:hypothetical protein
MSFTLPIQPTKVPLIPAIAHIDHTARLQTVTCAQSPLYYALLEAFARITGIPMVLNTSLNGKDEPIVETPYDVLRFFLQSAGKIDWLYLGEFKIRVKDTPSLTWREETEEQTEWDEEKFAAKLAQVKVEVLSTVYLQERVTSVQSSPEKTSILKLQVTSPLQPISSDEPLPWTEFSNHFAGDLLLHLQREMHDNPMNITFSAQSLWQYMMMKEGMKYARGKKKEALWKQFREALYWLHYQGYIVLSSSNSTSDS